METPVLHKLDQKIVIFRGFGKIFQNYWIPIKFLILIKFPNILHWKPAKKDNLGVVLGQNLGQIMFNVEKK